MNPEIEWTYEFAEIRDSLKLERYQAAGLFWCLVQFANSNRDMSEIALGRALIVAGFPWVSNETTTVAFEKANLLQSDWKYGDVPLLQLAFFRLFPAEGV